MALASNLRYSSVMVPWRKMMSKLRTAGSSTLRRLGRHPMRSGGSCQGMPLASTQHRQGSAGHPCSGSSVAIYVGGRPTEWVHRQSAGARRDQVRAFEVRCRHRFKGALSPVAECGPTLGGASLLERRSSLPHVERQGSSAAGFQSPFHYRSQQPRQGCALLLSQALHSGHACGRIAPPAGSRQQVTAASHVARMFLSLHSHKPCFLLFLDLKEAFYRVPRPLLVDFQLTEEGTAQVFAALGIPASAFHDFVEALTGRKVLEAAGMSDWLQRVLKNSSPALGFACGISLMLYRRRLGRVPATTSPMSFSISSLRGCSQSHRCSSGAWPAGRTLLEPRYEGLVGCGRWCSWQARHPD